MNEKMQIGRINTLKIDRFTEPGIYLMAEDENVVLLPTRYITEDMEVGKEIDVFLYTDSEDRLVATTERPKAMLDELALLEVVDVTKIGAFLDWGLSKDIFAPNVFQKTPFKKGEKRIVRIVYDEMTHRLAASERIYKEVVEDASHLKLYSEVSLIVVAKTPLGFKVIVNNVYEGMLFHNEIFEKIKSGDKKRAYIKTIRKDGRLDLTLQPIGSKKRDVAQEKVLNMLKEHNGKLPYNYKSDPEEIKLAFGLSKKEFKRTLTALIEAKTIILDENGITTN